MLCNDEILLKTLVENYGTTDVLNYIIRYTDINENYFTDKMKQAHIIVLALASLVSCMEVGMTKEEIKDTAKEFVVDNIDSLKGQDIEEIKDEFVDYAKKMPKYSSVMNLNNNVNYLASSESYRMSPEVIEDLKKTESLRLWAYYDRVNYKTDNPEEPRNHKDHSKLKRKGYLTIGYGHLVSGSERRSGIREYSKISQEKADQLFIEDVNKVCQPAFNSLLREMNKNEVNIKYIPQEIFDAYAHIVFNTGLNGLKRDKYGKLFFDALSNGKFKEASEYIPKVVARNRGLKARRLKEQALFNKGLEKMGVLK